MELEYSLDEKDFLEYQLYTASKSKNVNVQRRRTFIILIAVFILFFYSIYSSSESFPYFMLIIYILLLVVYKIVERKSYINHYKKFIKENNSEGLGIVCTLNFTEKQIIEKSKLGESKINYESLSEINEIQNYFFLKLLTGKSLVIPKSEINDMNEFRIKLSEIKKHCNLKENIELDWKWK